ncbi:hypothetical protein ABVT39_010322, partial [Epinephelus coioides]
MQTARPGPVNSSDFGTFICDLRRAAKIPQNRSIIQKMRRERRGPVCTGCPENTALRPGNSVGYLASWTGPGLHSLLLSFSISSVLIISPGVATPRAGHHPM